MNQLQKIRMLTAENSRLRAEIYLIRNALSKACGDDSDAVKACIDSQRDDPDRDDFRYEDPQAIFGDPRA